MPEDRGEDVAGAEDAEQPSPRDPGVRAARRGRRGARRVVAPATSGRPEAEEARRFHSASADGDVATSDAPGRDADGERRVRPTSAAREASARTPGAAGDGSPEESAQAPMKRVARPVEGTERLSPRDRWILQERPPHW